MGGYIPDNYDIFEAHERENTRHVSRLPRCANCNEPIEDDYGYDVDGLFCESCFKAWVDEIRVEIEEQGDEW